MVLIHDAIERVYSSDEYGNVQMQVTTGYELFEHYEIIHVFVYTMRLGKEHVLKFDFLNTEANLVSFCSMYDIYSRDTLQRSTKLNSLVEEAISLDNEESYETFFSKRSVEFAALKTGLPRFIHICQKTLAKRSNRSRIAV